MLILDSLLIGGIRFVLGKVADAVDAEMNDDSRLRERLLEAQMRRELGEISEAELAEVERDVLARLREIKEARGEGASGPISFQPGMTIEADIDPALVGVPRAEPAGVLEARRPPVGLPQGEPPLHPPHEATAPKPARKKRRHPKK